MDEQLKEAIEKAIQSGTLGDALITAQMACDHWSLELRELGTDLKMAVAEAHYASAYAMGHTLMEVEHILTDSQDVLERVAR